MATGATPRERAEQLIDDFSLFDSWEDRYRYLIDLGRKLPPFAVPTSPYRLSGTPAEIHAVPPRHGEHTEEVLLEYGFSKDEIAGLRASKVV